MDERDLPSLFLPRLDDAEGPALPLDVVEEQMRVRRALGACGFGSEDLAALPREGSRPSGIRELRPAGKENPGEPRPLASRSSRFRLRAAAALLVFASGSAAAAVSTGWSPRAEWILPLTTPAVATAQVSKAIAEVAVRRGSTAKVEAVLTAPFEEFARVTAEPFRDAEPAPSELEPPPELADLLGAANALRAERRYAEALERYLEIVHRHPSSPQAAAARLAAATLRLEHQGDPEGALDLLDGAPGSTSIPEAVYLKAESHRAAGATDAERRTLRGFIARHPAHPLAATAQRRLQALDHGDADRR